MRNNRTIVLISTICLVTVLPVFIGQTWGAAQKSTYEFQPNTVITIDTNPTNLWISYKGTPWKTPCNFDWPISSTHTVVAISPQAFSGKVDTLFQFRRWDNGWEGNSLEIQVTEQSQMFIAEYERFYRLSFKPSPQESGSIEITLLEESDKLEFGQYTYVRSGAQVTLTATPSPGYVFAGWENTIPLDVMQNNEIILTMSGPRIIMAAFGGLPTPPTGLQATAVGESAIRLTWYDSEDEEGYGILRRVGSEGVWTAHDSVVQNVTTYIDSGLVTGTTYYYRVWAFNAWANSDTTRAVWATPEGKTPTVVEWWPASAAKDVDTTGVVIWIRFNKTMNTALTEEAFTISPATGGAFVWEEWNRKMNFVPSLPLQGRGTQYEILLQTTAQDVNGNFLAEALHWTFSTYNPPGIESVAPEPDASGVSVTSAIVVTFDERMQQETVEPAFSLYNVAKDSIVAVAMDTDYQLGRQYVFTPLAPLTPETRHRASVSTEAVDSAGIHLESEFEWEFVTADISGPWVVDWSPVHGDTVNLPVSIWAEFSEPVDSGSVTDSTFVVTRNGDILDGSIVVDSTRTVFVVEGDLAPRDSISVAIQNSAQDSIRDLSGNPLVAGATWWFVIAGWQGEIVKKVINYPNPFHPDVEATTIVVGFKSWTMYSINIYDVAGRLVRELVRGKRDVGKISEQWDGRDFAGRKLAQGVYICEVVAVADDGTEERRYRNIAIFKR